MVVKDTRMFTDFIFASYNNNTSVHLAAAYPGQGSHETWSLFQTAQDTRPGYSLDWMLVYGRVHAHTVICHW